MRKVCIFAILGLFLAGPVVAGTATVTKQTFPDLITYKIVTASLAQNAIDTCSVVLDGAAWETLPNATAASVVHSLPFTMQATFGASADSCQLAMDESVTGAAYSALYALANNYLVLTTTAPVKSYALPHAIRLIRVRVKNVDATAQSVTVYLAFPRRVK